MFSRNSNQTIYPKTIKTQLRTEATKCSMKKIKIQNQQLLL